jgi:hypothetical protein
MFSTYWSHAKTFLRNLALNNTRDWFHAHKTDYDSKLRDPAKSVEEMSPRLSTLTGCPISTKLFRPHRDVRAVFHKTPYTTHLHMMWSVHWHRQVRCCSLVSTRAKSRSGTGMDGIQQRRAHRLAQNGGFGRDYLASQTKSVTNKGYSGSETQTCAAALDKDHTHGDLLRHKGWLQQATRTYR